MTQVQIAHVNGSYRVYRTELGIDRRFVGPAWAHPRSAARYADALAAGFVSPLRSSAKGTNANIAASPAIDVVPFADVPKARRRPRSRP